MTKAPAPITISDSTPPLSWSPPPPLSSPSSPSPPTLPLRPGPISPSPPPPSSPPSSSPYHGLHCRALTMVSVAIFSSIAIKDPLSPSSPSPFLMLENIRICTSAEEKENLPAKQQLFDPLVKELARDEKLLETNKMMLLQYATRKSIEENPIDWDNLGSKEEQVEEEELMDAPCKHFGASRCQKDRKFFIDLLKDFITNMCTLMKMLTAQQFNCLVTNEPTHTYFGCPSWTTLANSYDMEARERATFYLDYCREDMMVYYRPTCTDDDGPLTPDYDSDSARRNVELAS
ncbi:hypothetical protein D1007_51852 [Hordeum vulgare]|nr:hypothetical protein D1007_51852 [Hordeum vulgare]